MNYMHILHVIDTLSTGGAERMLVDIANTSVEDNHRVSVCITRLSHNNLVEELKSEVKVVNLNRSRRFDFSAFRHYKSFIDQQNIQIIHVHGRSSFAFCAFAKLLYRINVPIVLHDHRSIEINAQIPLWFRLWGKHYLRKYIGVYKKLQKWARQAGVSSKDIYVVGNGINLERFEKALPTDLHKEFDLKRKTLLGIVVAGLRPEKGLDLLIDSLSKCASCNFKFKILIVGGMRDPNYVEACKQEAIEKKVMQHLIFLGERSDAPRLIRSVDFALIPSRSESGPLVLIEYLISGLPIVAFQVGNVSQIAAQHGIQGFVKPEDTKGFALALSQVLHMSSEERKIRGQIGINVAQSFFSIQEKMPLFYEIYREALDKK